MKRKVEFHEPEEHAFHYHEGMTMRQYYKAAALQGLLVGDHAYFPPTEEGLYDHVVKTASLYADAMIAEDEAHEKVKS